jgi:hypothetical protein
MYEYKKLNSLCYTLWIQIGIFLVNKFITKIILLFIIRIVIIIHSENLNLKIINNELTGGYVT